MTADISDIILAKQALSGRRLGVGMRRAPGAQLAAMTVKAATANAASNTHAVGIHPEKENTITVFCPIHFDAVAKQGDALPSDDIRREAAPCEVEIRCEAAANITPSSLPKAEAPPADNDENRDDEQTEPTE